jgi:hypothetical protein
VALVAWLRGMPFVFGKEDSRFESRQGVRILRITCNVGNIDFEVILVG